MTPERISQLLALGENIAIEFKRCGNGIDEDTYESVCAFLNRFGGDLFMGVEDDGTIRGVSPKAAMDMARNFVSCISNPNFLSPTVYLEPEILEYEGKTVCLRMAKSIRSREAFMTEWAMPMSNCAPATRLLT